MCGKSGSQMWTGLADGFGRDGQKTVDKNFKDGCSVFGLCWDFMAAYMDRKEVNDELDNKEYQ